MAIQRLTITKIDGTEVTVTPNLGDTLNFEQMLRKNPRYGALDQNKLALGPFRAWSAGKREGVVTETWEEFAGAVADVSVADDDAAVDDENVTALGEDTATIQPTI